MKFVTLHQGILT